MSGTIAQNPNRQSGAIGSIPSATKDSGDPTKTTNPSSGVGAEWINTTSGAIFICTDATANDNTWIAQTEVPAGVGDRGVWCGGACVRAFLRNFFSKICLFIFPKKSSDA